MEAVRADRSSAAARPAGAAARAPVAAPLGRSAQPAAVLALQRAAGNAATGASLRHAGATGVLARCGAGGCTCGGACGGGGHETDELELQRTVDGSARQALARAVAARRATP